MVGINVEGVALTVSFHVLFFVSRGGKIWKRRRVYRGILPHSINRSLNNPCHLSRFCNAGYLAIFTGRILLFRSLHNQPSFPSPPFFFSHPLVPRIRSVAKSFSSNRRSSRPRYRPSVVLDSCPPEVSVNFESEIKGGSR